VLCLVKLSAGWLPALFFFVFFLDIRYRVGAYFYFFFLGNLIFFLYFRYMGKGNTMEDILTKRINGIVIGLKNGTKTPADAGASGMFTRLKPLNLGLHDDLMNDYKAAVKIFNEKHKK
jgi:hypothetical protein